MKCDGYEIYEYVMSKFGLDPNEIKVRKMTIQLGNHPMIVSMDVICTDSLVGEIENVEYELKQVRHDERI